MWGGPQLLPLLLLLLPGAVGLRCLRCGAGSCSDAANVTCDSDVCAEAAAAASWSHGSFWLEGRGCGRGQPGGHARALELFGLVVFVRSRQCRGGEGCGGGDPLSPPGELNLPGNGSAREPNGALCYGCPDAGPCTSPTVVQCYGPLGACFHGNVTLTLDGISQWREVRGCARAERCGPETRGDSIVRLSGSCCVGALCNGPPANRTLFAPDRPRLQLLPHPHGPTAAPNATQEEATPSTEVSDVTGGAKMAANDSKMAARGPKMAAGDVSGAKMAANDSKMAARGPKMAAGDVSGAKMAANDSKMAASGPKMAANDSKMAAGDVTRAKMAANDSKMAAGGPKMAAGDVSSAKMAANDSKMAAGDVSSDPKMAAGAKMAAGSPAPHTQRPLERKHPIPVGRGHLTTRPGWLLPLLLLPRL